MAARRIITLALVVVAALAASPVMAASCDDAAWDATATTALLAAAAPATPGAALSLAEHRSFRLDLVPQDRVAFVLPPERAARQEVPHGAVVQLEAVAAGTYRVALSAAAWIDVVQRGALIKSTAFVDFEGCPGLRKIVAFDIGAGPLTVQLSDAGVTSIAVAIVGATP